MSTKIAEKVLKLVQKIKTIDSPDFSFLKKTVAGTEISANDLENFASFNHQENQSYGRHLLYDSCRLKVFLMCWAPGDFIHIMGNAGNRNIMSLHIYGSDSADKSLAKRSRIYQIEKSKVITSNGPAFLNCPEDLILQQEYFDSFDQNTLLDYLSLMRLRSEKIQQRKVKTLIRQLVSIKGERFERVEETIETGTVTRKNNPTNSM